MLTYPSNYSSAIQSQFTENWIVQLYRDNSNFIGIGFKGATVDSVSYVGAITNNPAIRDTINVADGKSGSGNISLVCVDHSLGSNMFSKELYTNNYLNKTVKIYSILNDGTSLSDALQIFTGRLDSISLDETDRVTLSISSKRPWDNIELPNTYSNTQVPQPVAYGNYTGYGTGDFMTDAQMYPAPRSTISPTNANYILAKSSSPAYEAPHYYDNRADIMANLTKHTNTAVTVSSLPMVLVKSEYERNYKYRPSDRTSAVNFVDPEKAHNTDDSDFASATHTANANDIESYIELTLPSATGKFTSAEVYVKSEISITASSGITNVTLKDKSFSSHISLDTASATGSSTFPVTSTHATTHSILSSIESNNNRLPDTLKIAFTTSAVGTASVNVKLYDVWIKYTVKDDATNEPTATGQTEQNVEFVYMGGDGLTKSWDTNTLATKAHDVHRDLLHRFLGVSGTPINYTALSNQKNCAVRFWTEQDRVPIKTYLDELSYEGGFNFRFRANGDPIYHFIENSPTAVTFSDNSTTLTHADLYNMNIRTTELTDLYTKFEVQYGRHPAKNGRYSDTATKTNANRTDYYDGSSTENVKQVDLKHVIDNVTATGTNRNDSYLDYYDDLLGTVKNIISFRMVNPKKSNLEVGDVIAFSSMEVNPLNGTWSGKKYFITSTQRYVGGILNVEAREI